MKFCPEADIWPLMSEEQLKALAADIQEHGQQEPISICDGEILDGRNRWLAMTTFCQPAITPKTENVHPKSRIAYCISLNEKRRHLNESQRGHAAAKALPFFEAEAKERQLKGQESGRDNRLKTKGKSQNGSSPIGDKPKRLASDDAAKAFETTARTVQRGKKIVEDGSVSLNKAVSEGRLKLGKAEAIVKSSKGDKKKQDKLVAVAAKSKNATRAKSLTGEIEWYTPPFWLNAARTVLGDIDLDPASCAAAQKLVKANKFFSLESDGLSQPWNGRVFLNPPYAAKIIAPFTDKIVKSFNDGEIQEGIMLVNNATDTQWFLRAAQNCSAVAFTQGRISFLQAMDGEVEEQTAPTHGQAFFYFGPNVEKFAEIFSAAGCYVFGKPIALVSGPDRNVRKDAA